MAYYKKFAYTTVNQALTDLSGFLAAGGWAIDFDGVYQTSYRRLHVHKGAAHFDLYTSATACTAYGCTGYAAASGPSSQPGTSASKTINGFTAGGGYWLVSTAGGVFIGVTSAAGAFSWACFWVSVSDKIGVWADGFGLIGSSDMFSASCYSSPAYGQMYFNGAWSGAGIAANGLGGNNSSSDLPTKAPFFWNAGIMPVPVLITINDAVDSTKRRPMGFAPGLYRSNGGDLYGIGDELAFGDDTYLILPKSQSYIGDRGSGDYLFKLGS